MKQFETGAPVTLYYNDEDAFEGSSYKFGHWVHGGGVALINEREVLVYIPAHRIELLVLEPEDD